MSADSFHAVVESNMRSKRNLYDFQDFVDCVSKNGKALMMNPCDFRDDQSKLSSGKDIHYLLVKEISVIQFRKGSTQMYWKTNHSDDVFQEGEFLQKKHRPVIMKGFDVPQKEGPRGVTIQRNKTFCPKYGPMIPECRKEFWV